VKQIMGSNNCEVLEPTNPYAKAALEKYFRCGRPGHRSNKCPPQKPANLVE
jgi:hypothetical protein